MELYARLQEREAAGERIRIGLAGCGQMGSGFVHATSRTPGMRTVAIADIDLGRPLATLKAIGVDRAQICVSNQLSVLEDALKQGKWAVTEEALLLAQLDRLDALLEATGSPEVGAQVAWQAILNRKHIIMLNVETDVTVGVLLDSLARRSGCVYTVASGDEPAVCKALCDLARTLGFEVVCLGKGKNNPLRPDATFETAAAEAASKGMSPRMLATFQDGTKTMVEMAAVANATGLVPDVPGMHGPRVDVPDLTRVFVPREDGGILAGRGCVDYSTGGVAPGVFAIVVSDEPRVRHDMRFYSMGDGPYYCLYRPFHLCALEAPLSVAEAVLYGERTVVPQRLVAEVVAVAKRDLQAGERLGDMGGADIYGRIYTYEQARDLQALPIGLAAGARVLARVARGAPLTAANATPDTSLFVYKLRQLQDALPPPQP